MDSRPPTAIEEQSIDALLIELHEHFFEWREFGNRYHELVQFAIYEGCDGRDCCRDLLDRTASYAVANRLVVENGFCWAVLADGTFAVTHAAILAPVSIRAIEDGKWNQEEYDEPPGIARLAADSYEALRSVVQGHCNPVSS